MSEFIRGSRRARLCFVIAALAAVFSGAANADEAVSPKAGPAVISPDLPDDGPLRNDMDAFGGWKGLKGKATGFFHVEQLGGRTWLVTPEGNAYFMLQMGWAGKNDATRMKSWGFNSSEPDSGMPYTVLLSLFRLKVREFPVSQRAGFPPWVTFPDVFDPAWPELCKEAARGALAARANDPLMIGYFLDNEICLEGWYDAVTRAPKDAPCRAAFVEVARTYYAGKPDDLAKDWKDRGIAKVEDLANIEGAPANVPGLEAAWVAAVAEKAWGTASAAVKAVAPNHLNLGTRLINGPLPAPGILAAMGKYCDVLSLNLYNMHPDRLLTHMFTILPALNALTGRPTLVSEFSFRGGDTALPNTKGAWPMVNTQAGRAIGYLSYVAAIASIPSHVGVSWYKYPDDKPSKEWGGYTEDCNFGVVDGENRPYAVLTGAMRATNAVIYELASDPVRSAMCPLFFRTELARWDRPGDELLFQRLMHSDAPFVDPLAQALPEPRRYHENYWVRHRGPNLTINDDRFAGWCQANMIYREENGTTLTLFNVLTFAAFPRSLWLGPKCDKPDQAIALESNAQFLSRKIDADGQLRQLTIADGSFVRTDMSNAELRCDAKAPYLDLRFNPERKELAITTRGPVKRMALAGVRGWKATWNAIPLAESQIGEMDELTDFSLPE